jgi:hypothetical protein
MLALGCSRGEQRDFVGPIDPPTQQAIARVIVVPTHATVQISEPIEFAAFGRGKNGDSLAIEVSWRSSGGQVSGTGAFSAAAVGTYWVVARATKQPDQADSAQVLVVGPNDPITRLTVSPKTAGMRVGESQSFSAAAYYGDGSAAAVPIYWSASGGTIDANGLYTAEDPGDQIVIAVVGTGLSDTAVVHVIHTPVLVALELLPDTVEVDEGGELQFVADASWSDGTTSRPTIDFSTDGGVIDSTGLFVAAATAGNYQVTATSRSSGMVATAKVRIKGLESVEVLPGSVSLAPGATARFTANGVRANGTTEQISPTWSATGGTISSTGVYLAGSTAGTYRVIATHGGGELADTATVVITAAPSATLTGLAISPATISVAAGSQTSFSAAATWSDGSSVTPQLTWSASGGTISATGTFLAGPITGTYQVIARHQASGRADTASVTVTAARLLGLTVNPANAAVQANNSVQFSVTAQWSDGGTSLPAISWTATGGTIAANGLYTAGPSAGTFRVIARDNAGTVADTSFVTVSTPAPILQSLRVNPNGAVMSTGVTQQYYAQGSWSDGSSSAVSVNWTASGGSISAAGRYQAGQTPGTYRVLARQANGSLADSVTVIIQSEAPQLLGIALTPASTVVQPGGTQLFSVQGIWSGGGSGTPAVSFSATGGSITSGGLYTAGATAGTFRVIATQVGGTMADTSVVTISSAAPVLIGLTVSPSSASVVINGGLQYSVAGVWTNGGSGAPAVSWSATGGTVTSGGYYSAGGTAGTYRVIARQVGGTLADTATVNVTSSAVQLTSLRITPDSVNIQKGMAAEFFATATWSNGTTTVPALTWTTSGGGTISSSGRYVAGNTPGVYQIIARHTGGTRADTAQVSVLSPTVTKVNLTPASVSVPKGGVQQFSATATWSDGATRPVAVSYIATGGTITVNGVYTAGQLVGTFFVIANCGCGKSDTSTVTVTGPSGGTPTLVSLSLSPSSVTLAPSTTQQYSVSGTWSDNSTTTPVVSYQTNGGTISSGGLYTAPAAVGSYRVIATHGSSGKADTAAVTVQSGAPPPPPVSGASCSNEPAGLTLLSDERFDAEPPLNAKDAAGWSTYKGAGNLTSVSDPSAGGSSPGVLRLRWPQGMPGGGGPFALGYDAPAAKRTVFQCFWLKIDPGFTNNGNATTKFVYSWSPLRTGANYSYYVIQLYVGTVGAMGVWVVSDHGTLNRNMATKFRWSAHLGQWHKFEILTVANTQGRADGVLQIWVDGALDTSKSDVKYFLDGVNPAGWDVFNITGTYGGGTNPVPATQYAYVDNYRISGK